MRVQVRCVSRMPCDVGVWLVKRRQGWILYILEELLTSLGGRLPGCNQPIIVPRWRTKPNDR